MTKFSTTSKLQFSLYEVSLGIFSVKISHPSFSFICNMLAFGETGEQCIRLTTPLSLPTGLMARGFIETYAC